MSLLSNDNTYYINGKQVSAMYFGGKQIYIPNSGGGGALPDIPVPEGNPFNTLTWEQVNTICNAGAAPAYFQLGQTVNLSVGSFGTWEFMVIGINERLNSDDAVHGLIMQAKTTTLSDVWGMYSDYDYLNSNVSGDANAITVSYLPQDLRAVIADTLIYYPANTTKYNQTLTSATVKGFILSIYEIQDHETLAIMNTPPYIADMSAHSNRLSYYVKNPAPYNFYVDAWTRDKSYGTAGHHGYFSKNTFNTKSYSKTYNIYPCFCIGTVS